MRTVVLDHDADFDGWRAAARALAGAGVPAGEVVWQVGDADDDLLAGAPVPLPEGPADSPLRVPRRFLELAEPVACHADRERFALLYDALLRLQSHPRLLDDHADPLVHRLEAMERAVRRDIHKMRAFVRFRSVPDAEEGERFVAWFEPEHHIVRLNAPFFVRRFASMRWSILTPELCAHWDGEGLAFTPGAPRSAAPTGDDLEETWRTYYASTFNPARLKVGAMRKEMPKKYWRNLPETSLVPELIASASTRVNKMVEAGAKVAARPAAPAEEKDAVPDLLDAMNGDVAPGGLPELALAARGCTRCDLYKPATQTVFGEGPEGARLMFVGEQPGDQEDLAGRPFVGPAGQVFDRALAAAGIDRTTAYVTNSVKHFKFEPRGKRRIHVKPDTREIDACRWWLDHERALLRPAVTVALGATAARALTGKTVTISKTRGSPFQLADGGEAWITVHPSFLLRIEDEAAARAEYERFVEDLIRIRERVEALGTA